jgi:F-type H+-transporting ATPase subunit b
VNLSWYQFVWAIIDFLVILAILYKFFYNPVIKFLDDRRNGIARDLDEATQARTNAEAVLNEYQSKLAGAKQESLEIIDRGTKAGEQARQEVLAQSRNESTAMLEKARVEIQRECDDAIHTLRAEVSNLAVMAAGKILEKTLTEADHAKMVDEFLNEVGETN